MLGILKDAYTVYFDEMAIDGAVPLLAAAYAFHSSNELCPVQKGETLEC